MREYPLRDELRRIAQEKRREKLSFNLQPAHKIESHQIAAFVSDEGLTALKTKLRVAARSGADSCDILQVIAERDCGEEFWLHICGLQFKRAIDGLDGLAKVALDCITKLGLKPAIRIDDSVLISESGKRRGHPKVFLTALIPAPEKPAWVPPAWNSEPVSSGAL